MRVLFLCLVFLLATSITGFASIDGPLLAIAPPSSTVLAGIDVGRMAASRSGKYLLEQALADQDIAKLITMTGLNVRRDVQHILLVGMGSQSAPDSQHAAIVHGTFDSARLTSAGRARGASTTRYRGVTLLVQRSRNSASVVAFPRAGLLITGDLATVQTIIAFRPASDSLNPTLREQVKRIGSANDIWFATLLSGSFLGQQAGDALVPQLRNSEVLERISRSSGGLRFDQRDELTLDLIARSSGDARFISGLLRVASSLAHLQIGGNTGFSLAETALRSMQISVEGATVHAISAMPDEQLERALA